MDFLLFILFLSIALSTVLNILFKKIGVSHVIGYISTGTIITYLFSLQNNENVYILKSIAEFGIVFLMFTLGLEVTFERIKKMKETLLISGSLQMIFTPLIIYLISHFIFGINNTASIIISLAFSLSSTAIVLPYLKQTKDILRPYGNKTTAILIFQDLAVIPVLLLIGFLSTKGLSVTEIVFDTLAAAFIVILILLTIGRKFMSWLLHFSAQSGIEELFIASVLAIVIGTSALAHYMGFTYSLGAFIAGMIIAETKYLYKVEADISPFKDLLLGTFFFSVGMKIDVLVLIQNITTILLILVFVMLLKGLIIFAILKYKNNAQVSLKSSLMLCQIGEFAFAVFTLANNSNLMSDSLTQILILVTVLSLIITPFIVNNIDAISSKLIKSKLTIDEQIEKLELSNHIIVCGYEKAGKYLLNEIIKLDVPYAIITNNYQLFDVNKDKIKHIYYGDISKKSVQDALNIQESSSIIVEIEDQARKRLVCESILKNHKNTNIIVKSENSLERSELSYLNIKSIVDSQKEISTILVKEATKCEVSVKNYI